MANTVITKDSVLMIIDYGDIKTTKRKKRYCRRASICHVDLPLSEICVEVEYLDGEIEQFIYTEVDTVDTVEPISNADLALKISALIL